MSDALSPNTQAILLLTAPLVAGRSEPDRDLLTPGEYKRLARQLHQLAKEPGDLLGGEADAILAECRGVAEPDRLKRLLGRGFALSQAIDRWQSRGIWVVSRADADYPARLKERLKEDRPAVLYGCGEREILERGGLAVVGSREVSDALLEYTQAIGALAARARRVLVSGGARGIDQAAMRGALEAGGMVAGILADSLEKSAMNREHRRMLMDGQLVLVSPYDPGAGFNVGNAMQRNKLIYALADAALVVNSDLEKGGTWAGAVEQLEKLKFVPVFVRADGPPNKALSALLNKGALAWPNPADSDGLIAVLEPPPLATHGNATALQLELAASNGAEPGHGAKITAQHAAEEPVSSYAKPGSPSPMAVLSSPAATLMAAARESILQALATPKKAREIAADLRVTETQARTWIGALLEEGVVEKRKGGLFAMRAADLVDLCKPEADSKS